VRNEVTSEAVIVVIIRVTVFWEVMMWSVNIWRDLQHPFSRLHWKRRQHVALNSLYASTELQDDNEMFGRTTCVINWLILSSVIIWKQGLLHPWYHRAGNCIVTQG
jgi:hypothetical protein